MQPKKLSQSERIFLLLRGKEGIWVPLFNALREEQPPIAQYQTRLKELKEKLAKGGIYEIQSRPCEAEGCFQYRLIKKGQLKLV